MKNSIVALIILGMVMASCSSTKTTQRGFIYTDHSIYISPELVSGTTQLSYVDPEPTFTTSYSENYTFSRESTVSSFKQQPVHVVNNNVNMYHVEANQNANAVGIQALGVLAGMIVTDKMLGIRYHNYPYYYQRGGYYIPSSNNLINSSGYQNAYWQVKNDFERGYRRASLSSRRYRF